LRKVRAKPLQDFFGIRLSCSPMSQNWFKWFNRITFISMEVHFFFKSSSINIFANFRASASNFPNSSGSIQSNAILFKRAWTMHCLQIYHRWDGGRTSILPEVDTVDTLPLYRQRMCWYVFENWKSSWGSTEESCRVWFWVWFWLEPL
jgi:hypothetical protein